MFSSVDLGYQSHQAWLFQGVNLSLLPGQTLGILGPNGAGKTSLLRVLSGQWSPTRGYWQLENKKNNHWDLTSLARTRSVLSQSQILPFALKGKDLLDLAGQGFYAIDVQQYTHQRQGLIEALELLPLLQQAIPTLSGGELQRLHLARVLLQLLITGGKLLLLDEPLKHLDWQMQGQVMQCIAQLQQEHQWMVIWVEHDLNWLSQMADNLLLLAKGRVVAQGSVDEVLQEHFLTQAWQVQISPIVDVHGKQWWLGVMAR